MLDQPPTAPGSTPPPGKAKRVGGVFLVMLGSGLIIDVHAYWAGLPLMLAGGVMLLWGMVEARARETAVVGIGQTTESHP